MVAKRGKSTIQGTCERCKRTYFDVRYSGGLATHHCPDCRPIVRREKSAERARRWRREQAANREVAKVRMSDYLQRWSIDWTARQKHLDRLMSPLGFLFG